MKISWGYAGCLTLSTARHSAVPELCAPQRGGHCSAAGRCLQCIYPQEVRSNTMWFSHLRTVMKALKLTSGDDVQKTVTVVYATANGILCTRDMPARASTRLLSKCLLWLFMTQHLYPCAPANGFQLWCRLWWPMGMPHTYLETTCMRRYIQTETLHPKTKLYLLIRKVNKKRRVNFTYIERLHFYN